MPTTYGDRLLAEAEERIRSRQQRRRRITLLAPAGLILLVATWRTLGNRVEALDDVGLLRLLADVASTLGYAALLVGLPIVVATGARLNAIAAGIALATGPVLMPVIMGPGWSVWQRLGFALICVLVIAAKRSQPEPSLRRRGRRR